MTTPQQNAVNWRGHSTVVAVPGSGKTRVLICKTVNMINEGHKGILIISFTNAAADEIRQRLGTALSKTQLKFVEIATFHTTMLNHIKQNIGHGLLSPQQDTTIKLSILKRHGYTTKQLEQFSQIIEANVVSEDEDLEHARQAYVAEVLKTKQVTLSTVVAQGVEWMLEKKLPPLPFRNIFVDEFQDVCKHQLKLVLLHGLSGIWITVVGDDDQSVYGFRKALGVTAFTELERVLGAKRFVLPDNFRSHSEITELANQLIKQNKKRIPKTINSFKGAGGEVTYTNYANPMVEAERYAMIIAKTPHIETLVLARNGKYLDAMDAMLTDRKVAFENVSSAKSFDTIASQVALNGLMAIADNDRNKYTSFLHIILDETEQVELVKSSLVLKQRSNKMDKHSSKIHDSLLQARKMFLSGRFDDGFVLYFDMLNTQLDKAGYKQLNQLSSMKRYLQRSTGSTLKQRYQQLMNNRQKHQDATIKLMTMHTSKGLEAERVFVIGVSEKIIPSDRSMKEASKNESLIQSILSEERRLLFVALTRAMKQLHISSVEGTSSQKNRHGVSILLNEVIIDSLIDKEYMNESDIHA